MQVEWIILGDAAQVVDGKLYLLGGGWKMLTVNSEFPIQHQIGIAVSYEVPWTETNMQQQSLLEIQTADGEVIVGINVGFEVGRPPGTPSGPQRFQFAANLALPLKEPGTYVIVAKVDGQDDRRVDFHVVAPNSGRMLPRIA